MMDCQNDLYLRTPKERVQTLEAPSPRLRGTLLPTFQKPTKFKGTTLYILGMYTMLSPAKPIPEKDELFVPLGGSNAPAIQIQRKLKKTTSRKRVVARDFIDEIMQPQPQHPSPSPSPQLPPDTSTVPSIPSIDMIVLDLDSTESTIAPQRGLLHQLALQISLSPSEHLGSLYKLYHRQIQESKALPYFVKAAKLGCRKSMAVLGFYWEHGLGNCPINYIKAEYWYQKAANPLQDSPFGKRDEGVALAQLRLAFLKMYGRPHISIDQSQARYWRWFCNQQALHSTPLSWFKLAASSDIPAAQFSLASCYYNGIGTKKDDRLAFIWAGKAATFGHAGAQNLLGMLFVDGVGTDVQKDTVTGMRWYVRASAQGEAAAIYNIATLYERGLVHVATTTDNLREAFSWYQRAAAFGSISAANIVGLFHEQNVVPPNAPPPPHVTTWPDLEVDEGDNQKLAFKWYSIAAQQGHPFGLYNLGRCFMEGIGTTTNTQIALSLFEKAAHQRHILSRVSLGIIYEQGLGCPVDMNKSLFWWHKGAQRGSKEAISRLKPVVACDMLKAARILLCVNTFPLQVTEEAGIWSLPYELKEQICEWLNTNQVLTKVETRQVLKMACDKDLLDRNFTLQDFLDKLQVGQVSGDCPECAWSERGNRFEKCDNLRHWIGRYSSL